MSQMHTEMHIETRPPAAAGRFPALPARGRRGAARSRGRVARLLARTYRLAALPQRARLLALLLRPVGPLALAGIAAGGLAWLLPAQPWNGVRLTMAQVERFSAGQVFELARYVEQKSPELLLQLPQLLTDPQLWFGSVTAALLWLLLRGEKAL
jgi:hypothetical protein